MEAQVPISGHILLHLQWWREDKNLLKGLPLDEPEPEVTLTTDSSSQGWWAHIGSQYLVQGVWTVPELDWHINLQELETVIKACTHFTRHLQGKKVLVQSDNVTVVTYINHQGVQGSVPSAWQCGNYGSGQRNISYFSRQYTWWGY